MSELKPEPSQSDHYIEMDFTRQDVELVCRAEPWAKCQEEDSRYCSVLATFPSIMGSEIVDYGEGKISFPVKIEMKQEDDGEVAVWKVIDR